MRIRTNSGALLCALFLIPFSTLSAQQLTDSQSTGSDRQQAAQMGGGVRHVDPSEGDPIPEDLGDIQPSEVFDNTAVVANGVGLRNRKMGVINLVGIPRGATIKRAYLYWGWASLDAPIPGVHDKMLLHRLRPAPPNRPGAIVDGTLVGSGDDPCWYGDSNFVYRADVTAEVTGNGMYAVSCLHGQGAAGQYDSANPWPASEPPLKEGASLVVFYSTADTTSTAYLYDDGGLAGSQFAGIPGATWTLLGIAGSLNGRALYFSIGADGQTGSGYPALPDNGREQTTLSTAFGSYLAAGPDSNYNDSDWNGGDGKPLPQLWDTHGHDVSPIFPAGEDLRYLEVVVANPVGDAGADCLVAVANVLVID